MNIRIAGFGGQGIVMAGYVLGQAGILDGRNALQTQSYGSESRGGACKSDVIISQDEILDLAPTALDVLVVMAQPALDKFLPNLKEDGVLIYESDLVKSPSQDCGTGVSPVSSRRAAGFSPRGQPNADPAQQRNGSMLPATGDLGIGAESGEAGPRAFGLPATKIARKTFGRDVVANVIMLGCLAGLTGAAGRDALRKAISDSVPPKTVTMNLDAFEEGYRRGAAERGRSSGARG